MGTGLTQDWATDDFLPSQILQAIGQSFALTAVVVLAVRSMNPADVLTIGTLFQTSRLFGGEIGTAFMQTFVRVREQVHSNLIGLHVDSLGGQTADRLAAYRNAVAAHSSDAAHAAARGDEPAWRLLSQSRPRFSPTSTDFSPPRSAPMRVCS